MDEWMDKLLLVLSNLDPLTACFLEAQTCMTRQETVNITSDFITASKKIKLKQLSKSGVLKQTFKKTEDVFLHGLRRLYVNNMSVTLAVLPGPCRQKYRDQGIK